MNGRILLFSFLLVFFVLYGAGFVFAETSTRSHTIQALPNVGFFKCSIILGGAHDRQTRFCFVEKSSVAPQDARLNIQALVFDVAGNFFYTGKNIFTNIIRAIQDIGVSDSTHTLSLAPFNKDVKEGGVEDVLLSGTENVYLRFTFEGIGNDGVPRVKLQMIQKGVSASTSYIIELEGLDTMILEGQSIELALTGTDIALSLTFDGIQNGVPNIFVELIQTQ